MEAQLADLRDQIGWKRAFDTFLISVEAALSAKTLHYYRTQLTSLVRWAQQRIDLHEFRKSDLDRYLIWRRGEGVADSTRYHDAVCAKRLFSWLEREDYIDKDPLYRYKIIKAARL